MRGIISIAVVLALAGVVRGESALNAVKQLPKTGAARIARIEARGGTPDPERWYILTQDPASDNGVHEFVVAGGQVVASRPISQFSDKLVVDDIIGAAPLKIDSDKVAKIAHSFAEANNAAVASINYDLKKDGPGAAPIWTVTCLDDRGNRIGEVVVTADKGNIVSHDGFTLEPVAQATPEATPKKEEPHFDTYANSDVAPVQPSSSPASDDTTRHNKPQPKKSPGAIARTFQNVGRTLEKLNPF